MCATWDRNRRLNCCYPAGSWIISIVFASVFWIDYMNLDRWHTQQAHDHTYTNARRTPVDQHIRPKTNWNQKVKKPTLFMRWNKHREQQPHDYHIPDYTCINSVLSFMSIHLSISRISMYIFDRRLLLLDLYKCVQVISSCASDSIVTRRWS